MLLPRPLVARDIARLLLDKENENAVFNTGCLGNALLELTPVSVVAGK